MAVFSGAEIVNNGLVLHLDAGNNRSYPGSGTTWYDLSGLNNNGTLGASTTFDSSGYMNFGGNGSNTEAVVSTVELNTTAGQGNTVEQWIYSAGRQSAGNMPFTFYNIDLDLWFNADLFGINNGASLVYGITNADAIFVGKWVHVVVYFPFSWSSDYLNAKMWINGAAQSMAVRQGSLGTKVVSSSQTVGIGGGFTNGIDTYNWNGRISLTRIYNRQLSNDEVIKNFEATRGRYGI